MGTAFLAKIERAFGIGLRLKKPVFLLFILFLLLFMGFIALFGTIHGTEKKLKTQNKLNFGKITLYHPKLHFEL